MASVEDGQHEVNSLWHCSPGGEEFARPVLLILIRVSHRQDDDERPIGTLWIGSKRFPWVYLWRLENPCNLGTHLNAMFVVVLTSLPSRSEGVGGLGGPSISVSDPLEDGSRERAPAVAYFGGFVEFGSSVVKPERSACTA